MNDANPGPKTALVGSLQGMRWPSGWRGGLLLAGLLALMIPLHAQDPYAPLRQRMQTLVSTANLQGASLLLVHQGEVVYAEAFGSYGLNQRVPVASASKWLSGAAIARLVERGVMRWDDPVGRYLPNAPIDKQAITLRQLMSHSSGLRAAEVSCIGDVSASMQACVDSILATTLAYPPGTGFAYGGNSMQVAGRMAELATGQRWDDLFRSEVAEPLGMLDTDFAFESTQAGYVEVSNPRIAGGARSTLADYGRLLQALLQRGAFDGRQWLSPALVEQMEEDQTRGAPIRSTPTSAVGFVGYGIGLWREQQDGDGRVRLASSPGAFGFYPVIDREAQFAGVFLTRDALGRVQQPVQALFAEARSILSSPQPALPHLLVHRGYASGVLGRDPSLRLHAQADPPQEVFVGWRGDAAALPDARAWNVSLPGSDSALSFTAEFASAPPATAETTDSIHGARYLYRIPADPRGLVFSFHGSGGSGDLPFRKPEAQHATRLLLQRGFGVLGLDSANRIDRQWNPAYSLSNPDVINVQGILDRLRGEGRIAADTPVFCEGVSNGAAFCSRVAELLRMQGRSLMIAPGIEAVLAQSDVPTIWTLGRNDPTLAPGYLEQAQRSAANLESRGVAHALHVVESNPVYPERFARIPGIDPEASRGLHASLRQAGFLDPQNLLIRDPRGNALDGLIPTALLGLRGDIVAQLETAHGAHEYFSDYAHRVAHFFEAQLTRNLTGLWWNPDQPGWGISLAEQSGGVFPVWYTYDVDGRPLWLVGGVLQPQADGSLLGALYRSQGRRFDQIAGDTGATLREVGSIRLRLRGDGGLDFHSTVEGLAQDRPIELLRFGARPACRMIDGSRALGANRTDIWWNPREPGWGLFLAEQDELLVVAWYTYAEDGAPMWLLAALTRDVRGTYSGPLTRPDTGTPFAQIEGPATSFPVPAVGSARIEFVDGERGVFRYQLGPTAQSRDIERLVYSAAGLNDCQ